MMKSVLIIWSVGLAIIALGVLWMDYEVNKMVAPHGRYQIYTTNR